jgi:hypothetical protein
LIILCLVSHAFDQASKLLEACSTCYPSYVPIYTHCFTFQANIHHKNTAKATPIPATATTPPAFSNSDGAAAVDTLRGPLVVLEALFDPVPDGFGFVLLEGIVGIAGALDCLEALYHQLAFRPWIEIRSEDLQVNA